MLYEAWAREATIPTSVSSSQTRTKAFITSSPVTYHLGSCFISATWCIHVELCWRPDSPANTSTLLICNSDTLNPTLTLPKTVFGSKSPGFNQKNKPNMLIKHADLLRWVYGIRAPLRGVGFMVSQLQKRSLGPHPRQTQMSII